MCLLKPRKGIKVGNQYNIRKFGFLKQNVKQRQDKRFLHRNVNHVEKSKCTPGANIFHRIHFDPLYKENPSSELHENLK